MPKSAAGVTPLSLAVSSLLGLCGGADVGIPSLAHEYLLDEDAGAAAVLVDTAPLRLNRFAEPTAVNLTLRDEWGSAFFRGQQSHPKAWPGASGRYDGSSGSLQGALAAGSWAADDPWEGGWTVELWVRVGALPGGLVDDVAILQTNASADIVGAPLSGCEVGIASGLPVFRQPGAFNGTAEAQAWQDLRDLLLGLNDEPDNGASDNGTAATTPVPATPAVPIMNATLTVTVSSTATVPQLQDNQTTPTAEQTLTITSTATFTSSVTVSHSESWTETLPPGFVAGNATGNVTAPTGPWLPTLAFGEWSHVVWVYRADEKQVEFYVNGTSAGWAQIDDSAPFCEWKENVGAVSFKKPPSGEWGFDNLRFYAAPLAPSNVTALYFDFYQPADVGRGSRLEGLQQTGKPLTLAFDGIPPYTPGNGDPFISVRLVTGYCEITNATDHLAELAVAEWVGPATSVTMYPIRAATGARLCVSLDKGATWRVLADAVTVFDIAEATSFSLFSSTGSLLQADSLTLGDSVSLVVQGTGLVTRGLWDALSIARVPVISPPAVSLDAAELRTYLDSVCSGGTANAGAIGPFTDLGPNDEQAQSRAEVTVTLKLSGDLVVCYKATGGTKTQGYPFVALWDPVSAPLLSVGTGQTQAEWTTLLGVEPSFVSFVTGDAGVDPHFSAGIAGLLGANLTHHAVRVTPAPQAWATGVMSVRFSRVDAAHGAWLTTEFRRLLDLEAARIGEAINYTCPHCPDACPAELGLTAPPTASPSEGLTLSPTGAPSASSPPQYCNLTSVPSNSNVSHYPGLPTDMGYSVGGVWAGNAFTVDVTRQQGTIVPVAVDRLRFVWGPPPALSGGDVCEDGSPADTITGGSGNATLRRFSGVRLSGSPTSALAVCYSQPGDSPVWRDVATVLREPMRVSQTVSFATSTKPVFKGQWFSLAVYGFSLGPIEGDNDTIALTSVACSSLPATDSVGLDVWWSQRRFPAGSLYLSPLPPVPYTDPVALSEGRQADFLVPYTLWSAGSLKVCYYPGVRHSIEGFVEVQPTLQTLVVAERPSQALLWPGGERKEMSDGLRWKDTLWVVFRNLTEGYLVPNAGALCTLSISMDSFWAQPPEGLLVTLLGKTVVEAGAGGGGPNKDAVCDFTGLVGVPEGLFGWAMLTASVRLTDGSRLTAEQPLFLRHPCGPGVTCGDRGFCDGNGTCACVTGVTTGSWQTSAPWSADGFPPPRQCDVCAQGWYGPACDVECDAETTCSGRGVCGADGLCHCTPPYEGASCSSCRNPGQTMPCSPGSCRPGWYGADCAQQCFPATTCSGKGRCNPEPLRASPCDCYFPATGYRCDACQLGFAGTDCLVSLPRPPQADKCALWQGQPAAFAARSVELSADRLSLRVTLNQPSYQATSGLVSESCAQYLDDASYRLLWSASEGEVPPVCVWTSNNVLFVPLVPHPIGGVRAGTVLRLRGPSAVRRSDGCPLLTAQLPPATAPAAGEWVARVEAPTSIGSCADLLLSARATPYAVGVRARWSLVQGTGLRDIASVADVLAATNDTQVRISPGALHTEGPYRFRVVLTDAEGVVSQAEATVLKRSITEDSLSGTFPGAGTGVAGGVVELRGTNAVVVAVTPRLPDCLFTPRYGRSIEDVDAERYSFQWQVRDGLQRTVDVTQLQGTTGRPVSRLYSAPGWFSPLLSPYTVAVTVSSRSTSVATELLNAVVRVAPADIKLVVSGGDRVLVPGSSTSLYAHCTDPEVPLAAARGITLPRAQVRVAWGCSGPGASAAGVADALSGVRCPLLASAKLSSASVETDPTATVGYYQLVVTCTVSWISDAYPAVRTVSSRTWTAVSAPRSPAHRSAFALQEPNNASGPSAAPSAQPSLPPTASPSLQPLQPAPAPEGAVLVALTRQLHPFNMPLELAATVTATSGGMIPVVAAIEWRCVAGPLTGERWTTKRVQISSDALSRGARYVFEGNATLRWQNATHASGIQEMATLASVTLTDVTPGTLELDPVVVHPIGSLAVIASGWSAAGGGLEYRFSESREDGSSVVVCPWSTSHRCDFRAGRPGAIAVSVEVRDAAGTVVRATGGAVVQDTEHGSTLLHRLLGQYGYQASLGLSGFRELYAIAQLVSGSSLQWLLNLTQSEQRVLVGDSAVRMLGDVGYGDESVLMALYLAAPSVEWSVERDAAAAALAQIVGGGAVGLDAVQVLPELLALLRRRLNSLDAVALPADDLLAERAWAIAAWVAARINTPAVAPERSPPSVSPSTTTAPVVPPSVSPTMSPTMSPTQSPGVNSSGAPSGANDSAGPTAAPTATPVVPVPLTASPSTSTAVSEQSATELLDASHYLCGAVLNSTSVGDHITLQQGPSRLDARRGNVGVEVQTEGIKTADVSVALLGAEEYRDYETDLCVLQWGHDLLAWWTPAPEGLLWGAGQTVPTVTLVMSPLPLGVEFRVEMAAPNVTGWSSEDAGCGVWDVFRRQWDATQCDREEASQPGMIACRCAPTDGVPLHIGLLNRRYFTPMPTPAPTPAPTPVPPPPPEPPETTVLATVVLFVVVGLLLFVLARGTRSDLKAERLAAEKWQREPQSVRVLHATLRDQGIKTKNALMSQNPAEVVDYLVSRPKAMSERLPHNYRALVAAVDTNPWTHLLWYGGKSLPPSSLRYTNLLRTERLGIVGCCLLVGPLIASAFAVADGPLYFRVPAAGTVALLSVATAAATSLLRFLLLVIPSRAPAKAREVHEEETQPFGHAAMASGQPASRKVGGAAFEDADDERRQSQAQVLEDALHTAMRIRRLSKRKSVIQGEAPGEAQQKKDDSQGPSHVLSGLSSGDLGQRVDTQVSTESIDRERQAPRTGSLFQIEGLGGRRGSAVSRSSQGTFRRRSMRSRVSIAGFPARGRAPLLSGEQLEAVYFEEVRDGRLHTAVAVDLCRALQARGGAEDTSAPPASDFFATRVEESVRQVRQLFLRTFKDMEYTEAQAFLERRLGEDHAARRRKRRAVGEDDDTSSSSSEFDDITVSDLSDHKRELNKGDRKEAGNWAGDKGYDQVWEREKRHPLWEAGCEACKVLEFRLAACLFMLALLSDNPDLFVVLLDRAPPRSSTDMVEAVVRCLAGVGALFAYDFIRHDSDLRLTAECFSAAYSASTPPTTDLLVAICGLRINVGWRLWTWPGDCPYPVDEEEETCGTWDAVLQRLSEGRVLAAAHLLRTAAVPPVATDELGGVFAAQRLGSGLICSEDGTISRKYEVTVAPLGVRRSIATGRVLALFLFHRLHEGHQGRGRHARINAGASALLKQERDQLLLGAEGGDLKQPPPLPLPPAAALADSRNEWLVYLLNHRMDDQPGAAYCTPEAPHRRKTATPFATLCALSLSKGVRRGSGTRYNPYIGVEAAFADLRVGDALLLLPGRYPPFEVPLLTPTEERKSSLTLALELCAAPSQSGGLTVSQGVTVEVDGAGAVKVVHCQFVNVRGLRFESGALSLDGSSSCGVGFEECEAEDGEPTAALAPADLVERQCDAQVGCFGLGIVWRKLSTVQSHALAVVVLVLALAGIVVGVWSFVRQMSASAARHWFLLVGLLWAVDVVVLQPCVAAAVALVVAHRGRRAAPPEAPSVKDMAPAHGGGEDPHIEEVRSGSGGTSDRGSVSASPGAACPSPPAPESFPVPVVSPDPSPLAAGPPPDPKSMTLSPDPSPLAAGPPPDPPEQLPATEQRPAQGAAP
eukprot:Hpha_TRINITY_DN16085_c1_g17::TRINITY_DN16085_c1_g17_i1::g.118938::m.118938